MKRRTFVTLSSTFGIASAVSGASVVSSVYTSMNSSILLKEFTPNSKKLFTKFTDEVAQNMQSLEIENGENFITQIASPVEIISNNSSGNNQVITYKNKIGEFITLSTSNGNQSIIISKSK